MSSQALGIHRTDVDGVPVFFADGPPPHAGMLLFRVGRCDEPPAMGGVSHLVEHLVLHPMRRTTSDINGTTDLTTTSLFAEGELGDVAEFLSGVTRALADPPVDRIDREARVLLTEAEGRNTVAYTVMTRRRLGMTSYAHLAYEEFGLSWIGADHVTDWLGRHFTRGNCAVVLTAPPPDSLDLSALPDGPAVRLPRLASTPSPDLTFPDHLHVDDDVVIVSMQVPRTSRTTLSLAVTEDAFEEVARHESGHVYDVFSDYETLDHETAVAVVGATCRPDRAADVAGCLYDVLDRLADEGPASGDLDRWRTKMRRTATDAAARFGCAANVAVAHLSGEVWDPARWVADIDTATPADVAGVVAQMAKNRLLVVPTGVDLDEERFGDCVAPPDPPVSGRSFRPKGSLPLRRDATLIVGEDAVGIRTADGGWWSTPFSAVQLAAWHEDGSRVLYLPDGTLFGLDPADWRRGELAVALVDARVARETWVPGDPARPDGGAVRYPQAPAAR